ncbi:MAG: enterochelin esterase [Tepidisphaera sp.]|nr:enterochelin esterase [Tepidisphaera sp.]
MSLRLLRVFFAALLMVVVVPRALAQATPVVERDSPCSTFKVTFDKDAISKPYSGRVYVVLSIDSGEPRRRMGDWMHPGQVFALDVKDIVPGASVEIDQAGLAFPKSWVDAMGPNYRVQAVAKVDPDCPRPGDGAGDLYSDVVVASFAKEGGPLELTLKHANVPPAFKETGRVKLFEMQSPSLSAFYGRPFTLRAGVVLPKDYNPEHHYPAAYFITGFGGSHRSAFGLVGMLDHSPAADKCLMIVPDPTCGLGHSVFADSANNGPWGKALTEELIPAVEKKYHGPGEGTARDATAKRYVFGISSGGWSSLWLQVAYPDVFDGVWSHCPDPVDFHDFQRIDLYAKGANMCKDEKGERRPLARQGGKVTIWYDDFVRQETVLGPGGQIHSFEAVFSPREDGRPRPLFDRATGDVDPVTSKAWEPYDINLKLTREWPALKQKLAGKLHIYAGGIDTFYLEGAVKRLKASLEKLGSDAEIRIVDGMPHAIYPGGIDDMFQTIARDTSTPKPQDAGKP